MRAAVRFRNKASFLSFFSFLLFSFCPIYISPSVCLQFALFHCLQHNGRDLAPIATADNRSQTIDQRIRQGQIISLINTQLSLSLTHISKFSSIIMYPTFLNFHFLFAFFHLSTLLPSSDLQASTTVQEKHNNTPFSAP